MRKQRLLNDIQKILALNLSIAASFWGLNTQALLMVDMPKWSHFIKT